ncbi:putative ABC transport system substrate-binding protein [Bradyrhizobium lablabi]|uniref:Putative ABC transport system substrate-binding protein n=1 Tax=Bradyrhizobium lablabi TaxID=722472 RepID=A0A1M6UTY3_9BRAD|nr:ABC transporter substrate-binding protein [Bradyrhizobium lablabi]SHK72678.1 putative ABC transport system substrate-binding protein [Bradyrhizobium lablabi]
MKRRAFILALGGAAASVSLAARAQQADSATIGFLHSGLRDDQVSLANATRAGLREQGYVEGQNLKIEYRWAEGQYDKLPAMAAELVDRRVALIIAAGGSDPARAAKNATSTIPIVFVSAADPVRTGLVGSLNRPEANVTGISMVGAALEAKRLELLHEMLPQASAVGVLINPKYPDAKTQAQEVDQATARLGVKTTVLNASTEAEIDAAFARFAQQKVGAVLACNDPFFGSDREHIAVLALRHRLPAMSFRREFPEVGGLLSYGARFEEGYRQAGIYAGRILKGAKTNDLPVTQPTKFEMVINLKTAKAIGLAISESFLLRADEVIE